MTDTSYRYLLEFYADSMTPVGQVPITPDWEPALESSAFDAMRRGQLPALSVTAGGAVEPAWHTRLGEPYVASFRVVIEDESKGRITAVLPTAYFRAAAQRATAELIAQGKVKEGVSLTYLVCAYAQQEPQEKGTAHGVSIDVEEIPLPLPLSPAPLQDFVRAAVGHGELSEADLPVFVPRSVLDEAVAMAREAGDIESAGVLIGALHRDTESSEIFLETTALVPAPHTVAQAAQVTFTAETWAAVSAAVALRRRDEQQIGWFHSHPDFCRKCAPENRARCTLSSAFFSADDAHLHRTCFSKAFQVGLLISDSARTGLTWSLFGWRRGIVQGRGFYIVNDR